MFYACSHQQSSAAPQLHHFYTIYIWCLDVKTRYLFNSELMMCSATCFFWTFSLLLNSLKSFIYSRMVGAATVTSGNCLKAVQALFLSISLLARLGDTCRVFFFFFFFQKRDKFQRNGVDSKKWAARFISIPFPSACVLFFFYVYVIALIVLELLVPFNRAVCVCERYGVFRSQEHFNPHPLAHRSSLLCHRVP